MRRASRIDPMVTLALKLIPMPLTVWLSTLLALVLAPPQRAITSTTDLIAAMQRQYGGSWYKTATFVQKTTTVAADGTPKVC